MINGQRDASLACSRTQRQLHRQWRSTFLSSLSSVSESELETSSSGLSMLTSIGMWLSLRLCTMNDEYFLERLRLTWRLRTWTSTHTTTGSTKRHAIMTRTPTCTADHQALWWCAVVTQVPLLVRLRPATHCRQSLGSRPLHWMQVGWQTMHDGITVIIPSTVLLLVWLTPK